MPRRYAEDTRVPVARSRHEVDTLLKNWGCTKLQWSDDFEAGQATLRFAWRFEGVEYAARFGFQAPSLESFIREDEKWRKPSEATLEKRRDQELRALHRRLLLLIKGQLNAVDSGFVTAVEVFLPYLEDPRTGQTIAELAIPRLRLLLEGQANRMLPGPEEG